MLPYLFLELEDAKPRSMAGNKSIRTHLNTSAMQATYGSAIRRLTRLIGARKVLPHLEKVSGRSQRDKMRRRLSASEMSYSSKYSDLSRERSLERSSCRDTAKALIQQVQRIWQYSILSETAREHLCQCRST